MIYEKRCNEAYFSRIHSTYITVSRAGPSRASSGSGAINNTGLCTGVAAQGKEGASAPLKYYSAPRLNQTLCGPVFRPGLREFTSATPLSRWYCSRVLKSTWWNGWYLNMPESYKIARIATDTRIKRQLLHITQRENALNGRTQIKYYWY